MTPMTATVSNRFRPLFEKAASGSALNAAEAEDAFLCIMQGEVDNLELAAFLVALRVRGETVDEITGAVGAMRRLMVRVEAPIDAIDIVGTGGDTRGTHNISTATSFVVAGAGVPVAKHGNRAVSSKSGAADVLECLGVHVRIERPQAERCLQEAGIAFLFAPSHHPAMRFAAPVRQALKLRTIFNILGPLANPAEVKRQLLGVYSRDLLKPMAEALARLGSDRAWVVFGADGLDELSTAGVNHVVELRDGKVSEFEVSPEEAGLKPATLADLLGGTPQENAEAMRDLLKGKPGPYRDVVLLNAAAALVVAGRADSLRAGAELAAEAIDSGAAHRCLETLVAVSREPVAPTDASAASDDAHRASA